MYVMHVFLENVLKVPISLKLLFLSLLSSFKIEKEKAPPPFLHLSLDLHLVIYVMFCVGTSHLIRFFLCSTIVKINLSRVFVLSQSSLY